MNISKLVMPCAAGLISLAGLASESDAKGAIVDTTRTEDVTIQETYERQILIVWKTADGASWGTIQPFPYRFVFTKELDVYVTAKDEMYPRGNYKITYNPLRYGFVTRDDFLREYISREEWRPVFDDTIWASGIITDIDYIPLNEQQPRGGKK